MKEKRDLSYDEWHRMLSTVPPTENCYTYADKQSCKADNARWRYILWKNYPEYHERHDEELVMMLSDSIYFKGFEGAEHG